MRTGPPSSSSGPAAPASPLSGECHGRAGDVPKHTRTIAPGQVGSGCSRALFGQPLAALCGEDGSLPRPIQELLAVLRREGPSTEGIFRKAASGTELRELREALDRDADVDLGNQPALLLAAVLKDFLRSIPDKLLVTHLYEDWMAAMERTSKEEKVSELKAVAEKLPAANLFLLKRLLSLLQHIGRNAATSRMSCSNLAICLGPNLLSPPDEDLLPLQAMLEVTEKTCLWKSKVALQAEETRATRQKPFCMHPPLWVSSKELGETWWRSPKRQRHLQLCLQPPSRARQSPCYARNNWAAFQRKEGKTSHFGLKSELSPLDRGLTYLSTLWDGKVCRLSSGQGKEKEPKEETGLGR
ncbi:T-cell activation Rho GTPase-activating protein-like [Buteo buteo]|uniref:T-cell activation Rho GTPase-activating protein-like n=1 Tax=Buteo buteo TaxID=30397 RepID=UPI003EBD58AE